MVSQITSSDVIFSDEEDEAGDDYMGDGPDNLPNQGSSTSTAANAQSVSILLHFMRWASVCVVGDFVYL